MVPPRWQLRHHLQQLRQWKGPYSWLIVQAAVFSLYHLKLEQTSHFLLACPHFSEEKRLWLITISMHQHRAAGFPKKPSVFNAVMEETVKGCSQRCSWKCPTPSIYCLHPAFRVVLCVFNSMFCRQTSRIPVRMELVHPKRCSWLALRKRVGLKVGLPIGSPLMWW